MSVFDVIYNCRAMRRLKPDPVPEDLLVKLVDAAHQAPSGSNQQNGRWIVVRDPAVKQQLAALNHQTFLAYKQRMAGARPAGHMSAASFERLLASVEWQAEHFAEIPAIIIACLAFEAEPPDRFSVGAGAGGSIWPGVQNLLLAARALGLGATPTTFALADRAKAKDVLNLPPAIEPFCVIPVGYPLGKFGPVTRRPLTEILRWDRWS